MIELMIVVAIVGIIAAMSIAVYRSYIPKSQLNRAVAELGAYRSAVEDRVSRSATVTNTDIGFVPSDLTTATGGTDVANINSDGSGHIEVTMGGASHPVIQGVIVRWVRSSNGSWQCVIDNGAAASWDASFRPANCDIL